MQTLMLEVNETFLSKFITMLDSIPRDQVRVKEDKVDQEIKNRICAINEGKETLIPHNQFWETFEDQVMHFKNAN
ncbi:MAG: hypothetical protein ACXWB0_02875 [Sulfuricurvum sp.]